MVIDTKRKGKKALPYIETKLNCHDLTMTKAQIKMVPPVIIIDKNNKQYR